MTVCVCCFAQEDKVPQVFYATMPVLRTLLSGAGGAVVLPSQSRDVGLDISGASFPDTGAAGMAVACSVGPVPQ